jgi:hypothetical protein
LVVPSQFYTDLDISGSGIGGARSREAEAVGGAEDAGWAAVKDVGVDHGGDAKAVGSTPAMIVEIVPGPSKI